MPPCRHQPPRRQAGFALLIVLWSTGFLALLALHMTSAGRTELKLAANVRDAASAEAAADAGVFAAIFHSLDPATRWAADNALHQDALGRFALAIRIEDENGKVNPNFAPADLLAGLIAASGASPDTAKTVAAAIVDWRDPGAKARTLDRYRAAGRSFAPAGLPFRDTAELGQVIGMTPALLAALGPHLSVYADAGLTYAHADPVVQAVTRALNGGAAPPADLSPPPAVITITATAGAADGARFTRRATVALGPDPAGRLFRILAWRPGP